MRPTKTATANDTKTETSKGDAASTKNLNRMAAITPAKIVKTKSIVAAAEACKSESVLTEETIQVTGASAAIPRGTQSDL